MDSESDLYMCLGKCVRSHIAFMEALRHQDSQTRAMCFHRDSELKEVKTVAKETEQNDLTRRWRTMQSLTLFRSWIWLPIDLGNSLEWWSTGHSTRRLKDTVLNPSDHKFNVRHTAVPIPEPLFCLSVWCSRCLGLQTFFANSRTISERRAQGSLEKYSQRSSLSYDVFYNYTITLCDTRRRLVHFSSSSSIFNLSPRSLQDETTDSSDHKLRWDWLFCHFWKCSRLQKLFPPSHMRVCKKPVRLSVYSHWHRSREQH